jgi:hypothetical protein
MTVRILSVIVLTDYANLEHGKLQFGSSSATIVTPKALRALLVLIRCIPLSQAIISIVFVSM